MCPTEGAKLQNVDVLEARTARSSAPLRWAGRLLSLPIYLFIHVFLWPIGKPDAPDMCFHWIPFHVLAFSAEPITKKNRQEAGANYYITAWPPLSRSRSRPLKGAPPHPTIHVPFCCHRLAKQDNVSGHKRV